MPNPTCLGSNSPLRHLALCLALTVLTGANSAAQIFEFYDVTELPGGPGQGRSPSINNSGDIAFWQDATVYFFDRSEGSFLNLHTLPGAPAEGWFPKLNGLGNILFIDPSARDLWLFERDTQSLTNLATLPGYPGDTLAFGLQRVFDLNDQNQISLHSGDRNSGDIYLYEHATGSFENVSDRTGAPGRGRENTINHAGQLAYMGFPDVHVYDIASGITTRIDGPPGGAPSDNFSFNDLGDIAFFSSQNVSFYDATDGTFLDLSTLPGFPPGLAAAFENDLSDSGEITFWRDGLFYFDPTTQSFTRLNGQSGVPDSGMGTSVNDFGEVALAAGLVGGEDIFLAELEGTAPRLRLQINGLRPEPPLVTADGPTILTLDLKPGTFIAPLDWYYWIFSFNTSEVFWLTSTGVSATPAPLIAATPPLRLDGVTLLDFAFPPGQVLAFGFFLAEGGSLIAQDFIVTSVPGS